MAAGKTLADAYVELRADDSKLAGDVKVKATRVGREFGGALNRQLRALNIDEVDIKADPKSAIASIEATKARLQALSRDAATVEVKIKTERALGELTRFRKRLGDVGDEGGGEAAVGFVARFSQRLGPLMGSMPVSGPVAGGAGLLGAAIAPSIAAGIGAGLAAGVGAAGIAGGIALVAKDPQVAAAGKDVGQRFAAGVTAEAQSFKAPVLSALDQIDAAASRTVPKIGQIFRNTAPSVDVLTGSLIRTGEALTDSLVVATSRSAGPLAAIGHLVENVGTQFATMIDTLSRDAPAGTSAINDLTNAATNLIKTTTGIVHGIAVVKGGLDSFDNVIDSARFNIEDFFTKLSGGREAFDITADGYTKGSAAAELYRHGVIGINGSLNDYSHYQKQGAAATQQASAATHQFITDTYKADPPIKALVISLNNAEKAALGDRSALVGLSNQLRAQADPAFALIVAQNNLKTAQDKAAEATRKHGRNSAEARQATRDLASAAIDLQGKVGALGDKFTGKMTPAMYATLHAAHLTDDQIKDVAKQFRDAKKDGDRYSKRYAADARLTGGPAVSTKLKILGEMQAALAAGNKPASYYGNLNKALLGVQGPQINRAEGGPIPGWSPHKRADNIPAMLTAREYVQPVDAVDYYGTGVMKAIQQRKIPAADLKALASYAGGGQVWPYRVTASHTRVPSWKEAASKVVLPTPAAGGATLDFMVRVVRAAFPGLHLISGYRPGARTLSGAVSYHALRRASDWPPSLPLAEWINYKYKARTKELITPWNSLNIHNGARHTYTGAVFRQHNFAGGNAHDHWAMDNGGTLMPGWNTVYNGLGRPEPLVPAQDMPTIVLNNYGVIGSQGELDSWLSKAVTRLRKERKL